MPLQSKAGAIWRCDQWHLNYYKYLAQMYVETIQVISWVVMHKTTIRVYKTQSRGGKNFSVQTWYPFKETSVSQTAWAIKQF